MNKSILYTAFLTLFGAFCLQAMEREYTLSPKSIMSALPELPIEQGEIVKLWRDKNKELLKELGSITSFRGDIQVKNELLKNHGLSNTSNYNFTFKIPDSRYLVRLASTLNKRCNYAARTSLDKLNALEQELGAATQKGTESPEYQEALANWFNFHDNNFLEYSMNPIALYQGISRAERYVLLSKTIDEHGLDQISTPPVHLFPFEDTIEDTVSDQTHFALQQEDSDMEVLDFNKELSKEQFKNLNPETVRQLYVAYTTSYMWDELDNVMGIKPDGTVSLFDLEQPNRFAPEYAFLRNKPKYEASAFIGLRSVVNNFKNHGTEKQYETIKTLILTDHNLQSFNGYQDQIKNLQQAGLI